MQGTTRRTDTTVRLPRETVKRLRHRAIEENKTMKQFLTEIIESCLKNSRYSGSDTHGAVNVN